MNFKKYINIESSKEKMINKIICVLSVILLSIKFVNCDVVSDEVCIDINDCYDFGQPTCNTVLTDNNLYNWTRCDFNGTNILNKYCFYDPTIIEYCNYGCDADPTKTYFYCLCDTSAATTDCNTAPTYICSADNTTILEIVNLECTIPDSVVCNYKCIGPDSWECRYEFGYDCTGYNPVDPNYICSVSLDGSSGTCIPGPSSGSGSTTVGTGTTTLGTTSGTTTSGTTTSGSGILGTSTSGDTSSNPNSGNNGDSESSASEILSIFF